MYCATSTLPLAWIANVPALLGISMKSPAFAIDVGAPGFEQHGELLVERVVRRDHACAPLRLLRSASLGSTMR